MLKNTMKCTIVAAAAIFCFSMMGTGVSSAANAGPEEITLQSAEAKKPSKFPHKKHQEMYKCEQCHHTMANGKKGPYAAGEEKKCETCHNKDFPNPALNSVKAVGHALCKECHKKMEKEGKAAPNKCTGCHTS